MQYEELRTLAVLHHECILRLEARVADLEQALQEMTEKKEALEKALADKELELKDLWDKFEKKSMEFINERQAHRLQIEANERLEEEIKDLKRQITDLLQQIEDLKETIVEKEEENKEHIRT